MLDLFGTNKVNAKESIEAMTKGMTLGLLDAYEWRLEEKQREINMLKEKITEQENKIETLEELQSKKKK